MTFLYFETMLPIRHSMRANMKRRKESQETMGTGPTMRPCPGCRRMPPGHAAQLYQKPKKKG